MNLFVVLFGGLGFWCAGVSRFLHPKRTIPGILLFCLSVVLRHHASESKYLSFYRENALKGS